MMMTKRKVLTLAVTTALGLSATTPAFAVSAFAGATWPEQIVQEITLVESKVTQAEQLVQQMQMVENQLKNLQQLPSNYWQNATGYLNNLVNVVSSGNALALNAQNLTQQFQQKYPGWNAGNGYLQDYNKWYQTTNAQIANTLQADGYQASNFASEQQALAQVEAASQSSTGRLQAIQAGNQIAAIEATQLQKLRAIIIAENQSQSAYQKQQLQQQQAQEQAAASYDLPNVQITNSVQPDAPGLPKPANGWVYTPPNPSGGNWNP